jgi:hypothetical protein
MRWGYGVATVLIVVFALIALIYIACWVLHSLGFIEVAKRSPHANKAWMAWVPFCRQYLLGLLVPEVRVGALQLNSFPLFLAALPVALVLHSILSVLTWLVVYTLLVFVNLEIFRRYRPKDAVLLAIFYPIGYFIIRNQVIGRVSAAPQTPPPTQGYPPNAGYAPQQAPPQQPYTQPNYQQPNYQQPNYQQPYAQPTAPQYPPAPPEQPGGPSGQ